QLTTTCGVPMAASACAASDSSDCGSATSTAMKRASGAPVAAHSAATAFPRAASRPATTTCAPARAKRSAMARPMPEVPPMTTALAISAIGAVLALDVEEPRHRLGLEIHHRAAGLDAAADARGLAQQRGF